ncbi:MAG TPA: GntP family permease [Bacteroidales bacterium]|nr:GntP family permease [Bacteroidales bacterium]HOX75776.1 GntP family permease [Bacteroidales bacterium]HPM88449.1 GntP family permease [Bacteroidales bacterium]
MSITVISILVLVSIIAIILLTSSLKLNAFVALFLVSVFLAFVTLPADTIVTSIKQGFGNTMGSIGFLIIFGAMIGIILDRTGGTISIANYILSKTGEKKSSRALAITGFITGLPIFCDSGFIILSGLAKSFSSKSRLPVAFMATVLATSLYSVHCLIPPHPGALAAAGIMEVNVGNLILLGILFAVPGALAAYLWSKWIVKGRDYPPAEDTGTDISQDKKELPPVFLSFLPIVVPLLLITIKSLINLFDTTGESLIAKIFYFPGEPVFALATGVLIGLFLIRKKSIDSFNSLFTEAIVKAGPILIVTAAGGMFGMVIKSTGVGEAMGKLLADTNIGLFVPFLIALVMKTAQGSSTVAIITTASFVLPMLDLLGLDSEWGRMLTMLSMGAGSMIVSHANDSYFWVVSNFAGLDINTNLKVYSTSTMVMGTVVFAFVWISSLFLM